MFFAKLSLICLFFELSVCIMYLIILINLRKNAYYFSVLIAYLVNKNFLCHSRAIRNYGAIRLGTYIEITIGCARSVYRRSTYPPTPPTSVSSHTYTYARKSPTDSTQICMDTPCMKCIRCMYFS